MWILLTKILISYFGINYAWMVPALFLEVGVWVWCFIGYSLSVGE